MVVYGFGCGSFTSALLSESLPIDIVVAADPSTHGRALFHEFHHCNVVVDSASALLSHINNGFSTTITCHCIHFHPLPFDSKQLFWRTQSAIIHALRKHSQLQLPIIFIPSSFDHGIMRRFMRLLRDNK